MGYSYDDFLKQAKQAGLLGEFSQKDLETARINPEFGLGILRLKQDVRNATTAEQRVLANAAANQLRQSYGGYTGGADGSGSQPVGTSFDGGDAYQKLLQQVAQPGSFQYDPQTDPSYRAYRQQFTASGKRAAADALAAASASTGGIPSSYAVTAAARRQTSMPMG